MKQKIRQGKTVKKHKYNKIKSKTNIKTKHKNKKQTKEKKN